MNQHVLYGLTLALAAGSLALPAQSQNIPADLVIIATAGGAGPGAEGTTVEVRADGKGRYARYLAGPFTDPPLAADSLTLTGTDLAVVWQAIQSNDFFDLEPTYADTAMRDGAYAHLTVQADGNVHTVTARNAPVEALSNILAALSDVLPPDADVGYAPPERIPFTPRGVCEAAGKAGVALDLSAFKAGEKRSAQPRLASLRGAPGGGAGAHSGTVAGYRLSLQEAVAQGLVKLEGKGGVFGDQVSITATNPGGQNTDEVVISLYLEFWGPDVTAANVQRIVDAIEQIWSGKQASNGKTLRVEVEWRLSPGGTSPPGTAGYHQIKLVDQSEHSTVDAVTQVNEGVGAGTWATVGPPDETYAHEAGHLMGFKDQYDAYIKQADGTWKHEDSGEVFTADELAAIVDAADPTSRTLEEIKQKLAAAPEGWRGTVAHEGHWYDLMGNDKPGEGMVQQAYVDALAAHDALVITIEPGDILVNKDGDHQNYVVTHAEALCLAPGETKTLHGLYAACIDLHRSAPDSLQEFDVAPPLSTWQGIPGASFLLDLVRHLDAQDLFCDTHFVSQLAIWRLTDDANLTHAGANALLAEAGIELGEQLLRFPHLDNRNPDPFETGLVLPVEVVTADVTPATVLTSVGATVTLEAALHTPAFGSYTADYGWTLEAPTESQATLPDAPGATVSFTPDRRGLYTAGLRVQLAGPTVSDTTFERPGARITAADEKTDTFERSTLTVPPFPWQTAGDAPWQLTDVLPNTGAVAAASGTVEDDQASTLTFTVTLAEAGDVAFAYRTSSEEDYDVLSFAVDGVEQGRWSGETGWSTAAYPLAPGQHTLTWTYAKDGTFSEGADRAWIDDVFLPLAAVGVATAPEPDLPKAYALAQNYPNPFNPTTEIAFSLPEAGTVRLVVYDVLGRVVARLVEGPATAGRHAVRFDAGGLPSGVYFYHLTAGPFSQTRRMTLLR